MGFSFEAHSVGSFLRSRQEFQVPQFSSNVVDQAGALRQRQAESLRSFLDDLQQKTESQVSVLIVRSLQGRPIEDFSIKVVDAWGVGKEASDKGVLLLVALDDRKMRIEVGQGLEGDIPDAFAKRIIDQNIAPFFRSGDVYGGVQAGVVSIVSLAEPAYAKQVFESSPGSSSGRRSKKKGISWFSIVVFLLIFGLRGGLFGLFGARRSGIFYGGGGFGRSGGFGGGGFGGGGGGGFSGGGASGGW